MTVQDSVQCSLVRDNTHATTTLKQASGAVASKHSHGLERSALDPLEGLAGLLAAGLLALDHARVARHETLRF